MVPDRSAMEVMLGPGVLTTVGGQHKHQRKMLNPVFSTAHLRDMTHIFYKVAHRVRSSVATMLSSPLAVDTERYISYVMRWGSDSPATGLQKCSTSTDGWRARRSRCSDRRALGTRSTTSMKTLRTSMESRSKLSCTHSLCFLLSHGFESSWPSYLAQPIFLRHALLGLLPYPGLVELYLPTTHPCDLTPRPSCGHKEAHEHPRHDGAAL